MRRRGRFTSSAASTRRGCAEMIRTRSSPSRSPRWSGPGCAPPTRGRGFSSSCATATRCRRHLAARPTSGRHAPPCPPAARDRVGVTELAVTGALGEPELRHQLRLDPRQIALARGIDERGLCSSTPCQLPMEIGERCLREAGADLPRVAESGAIPGADEERAEVLAGAARRRESADHELLFGPHLHLGPRRGALSRAVPGPGILADHAFQSPPSRLGERLQTVGGQTPGDPERRPLHHLGLEHGATGGERLAGEVAAAGVQAIEDDVDRRRGASPTTLEQLEARHATGIEDDDLAVHNEGGGGQRGQRGGDVRKIIGPVLVVAGEELDPRGRACGRSVECRRTSPPTPSRDGERARPPASPASARRGAAPGSTRALRDAAAGAGRVGGGRELELARRGARRPRDAGHRPS